MKKSTERRLFQYALKFKKGIIIGIICLMVAVGLELMGPLIAKKIIDDHILGVEGLWHEVEEEGSQTALYKGKYFKREDRLTSEDVSLGVHTVLQVGMDYYMIGEEVALQGTRSVEEGEITIERPDGTITVPGTKMSLSEVYPFFKPEQKPIIMLLILYITLIVIAGFFQYSQTFLLQKSSNQIIQKMRNDVFAHIQRLPMKYFVDTPAGSIVSRITNDTEAIRDLYERVLSILVSSGIYMFGIFIALFILDMKLALICLLVIPLIYGWMRLYKYFGFKFNRVIRSTLSKINGSINEAIQGMSIIQAFRQEKNMKDQFEELNERHYTYQKKLILLSALTSFHLVTLLRNLTFVGFIWYFGSSSIQGSSVISIGLLYAFVDYITRLFEPVNRIVSQLPIIEQARVAGGRVFEVLDLDGERVNTEVIDRYKGIVEFDRVTFSYDGETDVLKDVSFKVNYGETVAFVGHTGSGKSTIMNLLFRFYDPQKGKILIDGQNIAELSRQQVRSYMGIVLQDPFLFTGTILSNVTMNDPRISRETAIKALKAVGADKFIERLPDKYDSVVTEGGGTFSLGERQLISFARALAFDPAILILDEATANIDTETETIIQQALEVIQKGRTSLVIAHRLSTIQDADKIYVLDKGEIQEVGKHDELLKLKGLYYQMYEMQQGGLAKDA